MNRRDSIKAIGLSAISATALLEACKSGTTEAAASSGTGNHPVADTTGRQDFEIARDKTLVGERFFDAKEMATIAMLADIIIPRDEKSGSATDAGVPAFIEFIVKDEPQHQLPMRGGLRWLDMECLDRWGKDFVGCTPEQRIEVLNDIAYPFKAGPGMQPGVTFFNKMRELTAIGFFTSKMGIEDLGYKGNSPGKWEGVPPEVLKRYGL
ncbi:gluconate 2-dehydrogenase subunit 3 family protein [Puia dinghuensis]|uniref:Transcriptional initiation protein Tat n=1 Tax=Puia dinghuensis TaxID=1792502 RepID=A0A8J2UGK2_9BACT|nr:gluconate 2-dehydrogenase subunit 3 family protein [Puia dinghuensis]GGB14752.1 transcriptional initiation protein Tat [Puia dinghuensis]